MADAIDPASRLDKLIAQQEPKIAAAFRQAVAALRDEIDLDEIADLIESGRIGEAVDRLEEIANRINVSINNAYITAGQSTAQLLTDEGLGRFVFNAINLRAVQQMQTANLERIAEFTTEQRAAVQFALTSGLTRGENPRETARTFRNSIGLTESQLKAVDTYRTTLEGIGRGGGTSDALDRALRDKRGDAQIKRAAREDKPLAKDKIDWLVQRYSERYVRYRSEVIGRTEAMMAVNAGDAEGYEQQFEAGLLDPEDVEKQWLTNVDGRERRAHRLVNRQKRRYRQDFDTIDGPMSRPGDSSRVAAKAVVQCRCTTAKRIRRRRK